jgi:hypothetical protein
MNGNTTASPAPVTRPASAVPTRSQKPGASQSKPAPYKPNSRTKPAANAKPDPNAWFKKRFPKLADKHGEPVAIRTTNGNGSVQDLNESFLAECFGPDASPDAPTVYLRGENRFYTYRPDFGIYTFASEEDVAARFSALLLSCARDCKENCDVSKLQFSLRDTASLAGAV